MEYAEMMVLAVVILTSNSETNCPLSIILVYFVLKLFHARYSTLFAIPVIILSVIHVK
jgi:hypothetical protein